jgi:hypothetical protein
MSLRRRGDQDRHGLVVWASTLAVFEGVEGMTALEFWNLWEWSSFWLRRFTLLVRRKARVQACPPGRGSFLTADPALETPGYFRVAPTARSAFMFNSGHPLLNLDTSS